MEEIEAQRKQIEAKGIQQFQATLSKGLSDQVLAWLGIRATEDLAKSENTKVVFVGNKGSGLPMVQV